MADDNQIVLDRVQWSAKEIMTHIPIPYRELMAPIERVKEIWSTLRPLSDEALAIAYYRIFPSEVCTYQCGCHCTLRSEPFPLFSRPMWTICISHRSEFEAYTREFLYRAEVSRIEQMADRKRARALGNNNEPILSPPPDQDASIGGR